ncbi:MAG: macrocin O-methyltransferase [Bacteroidia bacterium]|nr:macrocin O-methyltransferase [Bacteroidia bacterium]
MKVRGFFKGLFYFFRMHWFFGWCSGLLIFLGYSSRASRWIARHSHLKFNDFYVFKRVYNHRLRLFEHVIETEKLSGFDYLEFGVSKGHSFQWWRKRITDASCMFYGFDTFTGLPEDWGPYKKGDMSSGNSFPDVEGDARCIFIQGLFQQTLPGFLANHAFRRRLVVHIDADLYSSTLYVLTTLHPYLKKGDILLFDEFNVPVHEFKAWCDYVESYYVKHEVLGAVNNFLQVAIRIN